MSKVFRERTNLRTFGISILVAGVGILLFIVSRLDFMDSFPELQSVVKDLGSLLIASIAVALIWELFSKRAFMSELLTTTRLADEIQESGLIRISPKWHGEIDWTSLFRRSDNINIFFMYGRTWRNINRAELQNFARRANTKATIILPNHENAQLMLELARGIEITADDLRTRIVESIKEFIAIFDIEKKGVEKLTILSSSTFPVYSSINLRILQLLLFMLLIKARRKSRP
jgi:hypothetical protein